MDSGLYLEYEKDFNANFKEMNREENGPTIGHTSDFNTSSNVHNSFNYVRTTPYVPGLNVKMGNISKIFKSFVTFYLVMFFRCGKERSLLLWKWI